MKIVREKLYIGKKIEHYISTWIYLLRFVVRKFKETHIRVVLRFIAHSNMGYIILKEKKRKKE